MRRKITAFLLIFCCFLLQCTVFKSLNLGGISPNLLIVITSSIGVMTDEKSGLLVGFFSGLLIDVFFGDIIGFYALLYMYIGYINGKFSRIFYPEDIKLPICLITLSDISFGFICYVFLYLLQGKFNFPYYLVHIILPEAVYTIVISLVLYPLLLHINRKLEERERKEAELV